LKSIKKDQAKVFDKIAKDYREIHNENIKISGESSDYFAEYKILELKNKLLLSSPLKIIDLGCGDGISGLYFNKHFKDIEYYGFDISEESIKIAKERKIEKCKFEFFDGNKIPSENNFFDLAFISCVLHHIDHTKHLMLLQECYRVLKKGGKLIIFEHNPFNPITRKIVRECIFDKDAVLINSNILKRKTKKAGFLKSSCNYTLFFPRIKIFKSLLFLEEYLNWFPMGAQYYIIAKK
jgi:ubiquinone/menaquinone biosynthesis C-methylase UbiE